MFYLWSRNKHVARENMEGHLRITTTARETFFEGTVAIVIRVSDLQIVSLEASMPRPINEECPAALPILQQVVGHRVMEGLTKRLDGLIGGPHGCTHMTNLVLESCHAAAVGYRQIRMAEALSAGLSPDDYYREWIKTRPKELRNSCVAFMDSSDLFQRVTAPVQQATQAVSRSSRMAAATTLPFVQFARNKFVGVGRLHRDVLMSRAQLEDNAHSMAVEIEVRRSDLQIVAARGAMMRTPNDVCPNATDALQSAVGLGIRPGLTAAVDENVGRKGCPHLGNLLLEACHGIIQGSMAAVIDETRAEGNDPGWDDVRREWLAAMPLMRNSCLAYQSDSALMRRIGAGAPV